MGKRGTDADQKGDRAVTEVANVGFATPKSVNRVRATWVGGQAFDCGRPGGPAARVDGNAKTGPSPVDTLLNALACCTSIDVVSILEKRRTPVATLDVDVAGARANAVPSRLLGINLVFHITGDGIERAHAERAIELAVNKYCSVRDSLDPELPITWDLVLNGV
jgi:putative redox protein